ncbi:MAG: hypothetical protein Q8P18_20920 [Pseudomonadota bacterium]|nr:hypothetical protein [Pseudomonadota bacterium]
MPHLENLPAQTDERALRECLRAIVPGLLVAVGVVVGVLVMRAIYGFPGWLSLLLVGFAAFTPIADATTAFFLWWALRSKRR